MTITEAYTLYEQQELYNKSEKTRKNYRSAINSLTRAVGDVPVLVISKQTVARWEWDMQRRGNSGTSMRTDMSKLKQILLFLRDNDVPVMSPREMKLPKNDTQPREWLVPEDIAKMLKVCKKPRDRALLAVLWATGARISEVLSLDRSDLEKEHITILGKGGKYRDISLDVSTKLSVEQYLATRTDNYPPLFLSSHHRRMGVQRAEQILHDMAHEAGIDKNVTPHIIRHSFVSDMLNNNAPVKEVSELVGHAQTSTTLNIYHHILPTQKWEAKKKYHTPLF